MNKLMIYLQGRQVPPIPTGEDPSGAPRKITLQEKKFEAPAATPEGDDVNETIPSDAVPLLSVIAKIKYLASLGPTELAEKMDTQEGANLAQVETETAEPRSLLRPWKAIRRASPKQLTDKQYDAFLRGEHPDADVDELYGAHLQSET
jgi:hypothetical protein